MSVCHYMQMMFCCVFMVLMEMQYFTSEIDFPNFKENLFNVYFWMSVSI